VKKLIGLFAGAAVLCASFLGAMPRASADDPVVDEPTLSVVSVSVVAGAAIDVEATGFAPGETLTFVLVGVLDKALGSATVSEEGDVEESFTVPASTVAGSYELTVTGDQSTLSASVTVAITSKYHLLKFDARGGALTTTAKAVAEKAKYGTLPKPTRSGYTFQGWFTKASGGTKITTATKMGTTDKTVYAQWKAKSYKVTFNANGGSVNTKSKTVTMGKAYGTLPTPKRTGYTFVGWFTAKSGGTKIVKTTSFSKAAAQTLYAQWQAKTSTVKLNPKPAKLSVTSIKVTYNQTYQQLPTPHYQSKGDGADSRFLGWYTKSSGGTKVTNATKVKITSTQTLYAQWKHPWKALCKDGTYSYSNNVDSKDYRGMCSYHGGIKTKLGRVP